MIYEIAKLTVGADSASAFEDAVAQAAPLFKAAEGCRSMALHRIVEEPASYHLMVGWESVAHHMDLFRASPAFQQWRALVGGFFVAPPQVIHTDIAATFF